MLDLGERLLSFVEPVVSYPLLPPLYLLPLADPLPGEPLLVQPTSACGRDRGARGPACGPGGAASGVGF
jgi:hypothetical protein